MGITYLEIICYNLTALYGFYWKRTILRDDNEQHMTIVIILGGFFYAKKQISRCRIHSHYGNDHGVRVVVYNVALNMGKVTGETFLAAVHELPIMVPVAFVLEFFIVGKIAKALAFTVVTPDDRPQIITYAISICICCIMCPLMSLVATLLFKETKTFGTWIQTWAMNFLVAICYQMFYCGPLVRLIFRTIFERKGSKATEQTDAQKA